MYIKSSKYLFQVLYVLFVGLAGDEDIETTQNSVDELLESLRGIS